MLAENEKYLFTASADTTVSVISLADFKIIGEMRFKDGVNAVVPVFND